MMVAAVIPVDKRKSKVFLEEGFAFVLYRGEVERYRIEEGRELEDRVYEEILRDVLCPRSKEYAPVVICLYCLSLRENKGKILDIILKKV